LLLLPLSLLEVILVDVLGIAKCFVRWIAVVEEAGWKLLTVWISNDIDEAIASKDAICRMMNINQWMRAASYYVTCNCNASVTKGKSFGGYYKNIPISIDVGRRESYPLVCLLSLVIRIASEPMRHDADAEAQ